MNEIEWKERVEMLDPEFVDRREIDYLLQHAPDGESRKWLQDLVRKNEEMSDYLKRSKV